MTCAKVMTSFTSSVLQLWKLVVELHLTAAFSLPFLPPPEYSPKHFNSGVNCGMAKKQHLTLGMNLWPLYIKLCVNSTLAHHGLKTSGLKQQTLTLV